VNLQAEDLRHLTAAHGYVELGMYLDANAALEEITAEVRHLPEVLALRVQIYRALEKWELMRTVAASLATLEPGNPQWAALLAFATRRAESLEAARSILLEAVERHPDAALLHYNLACYECQLGDVEVAKFRLSHAVKLDGKLRPLALGDEDLKPIWQSLAE
jgi:Tfp pilus assembly protein PilF